GGGEAAPREARHPGSGGDRERAHGRARAPARAPLLGGEALAEAAVSYSGSANDLSRRALALETSPTVAMSQRAAALKARGLEVLDFSAGEPDQPTPRHIASAAVTALGNNRTRYTPSAGLLELREAVAARYKKEFKVEFTPS